MSKGLKDVSFDHTRGGFDGGSLHEVSAAERFREANEPAFIEGVAASFRANNPVYNFVQDAMQPAFKADPNYHYMDDIDYFIDKGYSIEDLKFSKSKEETEWIASRIEDVRRDEAIVRELGGVEGFVAGMVAEVGNPFNYVGFGVGGSITRMVAVELGALAASEAILHQSVSQSDRTLEESLLSGMLVGGLTAGFGKLAGRDLIGGSQEARKAYTENAEKILGEEAQALDTMPMSRESIGSAKAVTETMEGNTMTGGAFAKTFSIGASAKLLTGDFLTPRLFAQKFYERSFLLKKDLDPSLGSNLGQSIEDKAQAMHVLDTLVMKQSNALFREYKKATPKQERLTAAQFEEEVYTAMINGDKHAIKEVEEAAKANRLLYDSNKLAKIAQGEWKPQIKKAVTAYKAEVKNKYLQREQPYSQQNKAELKAELEKIDEVHFDMTHGTQEIAPENIHIRDKIASGVKVENADAYAPIFFVKDKIINNKEKFYADFRAEFAKNIKLKGTKVFTEKGETYVVLKEDVARFEKQFPDAIENKLHAQLDEAATNMKIEQAVTTLYRKLTRDNKHNKLTGTVAVPRQVLERVLKISQHKLKDYTLSRADEARSAYVRENSVYDAMFDKLGETNIDAELKAFDEEVRLKVEQAKDAAAVKKIEEHAAKLREIMEATPDILMGKYGLPSVTSGWVKAARLLRLNAVWSKLGGGVLSNMAEYGSIYRSYGLIPAATHTLKYAAGFRTMSKQARREIGASLNWINNAREGALLDVTDDINMSKLEREAYRIFFNVSLINGWTDFMQGLTVDVASKSLLTWMKKGTNKQKGLLRRAGLDDDVQAQIIKEYETTGSLDPRKWSDKEAANAWRSALRSEMHRNVIQPTGGDRPLWMHTETGKFFTTFMSFIVAAQNKMLVSGIQQADANFISGLMVSLFIGDLINQTKAAILGYDVPDLDTPKGVMNAIERVGMFGVPGLGAMSVYNAISGDVGATMRTSRTIPSVNVNQIYDVATGTLETLARRDFEKVDKLIKTAPANDLLYWRTMAKRLTEIYE